MIQATDSIDVSLSEKVGYDCYPVVQAITSKLQGLSSRITDSNQKIAGVKKIWRVNELDESHSENERLFEYLIMRTEDFSEAQDLLCRGLRSLLASTAYPLLESNYMLRFYGHIEDGETTRKAAAKYVKHVKRMMSLIERAMEISHNKTDFVYEWCETLKLFANASCGSGTALTRMAIEIRSKIGNDINFKKALDSNKHQKNRYERLAIKPPKEVSISQTGNFGPVTVGRDLRQNFDSPGANLGDADTINMQVNVGAALSELYEILQKKNVPKHDITEIQAEEGNLKNPDPEVRKTALEKIWGKVKSMANIVNDSEDIVNAVKTLCAAAGIALAVIGL